MQVKLGSKYLFTFFLVLHCLFCSSQNETKHWLFGNFAGLDFSTIPPTVMSVNNMFASYASASISDASGNLLFYTNGTTVWDRTNITMANGNGLIGNTSGAGNSQGVIILKKPLSANIYYIFTSNWNSTTSSGLYYSEVDMSLASGNGSVTVKNTLLFAGTSNSISVNRLTATKHCNGTDIWLVGREWTYNWASNATFTNNTSFHSYLITSLGVSAIPVLSSLTTYTYSGGNYQDYGCMKISPNGKKLGIASYAYGNTNNTSPFVLYDFDNTTGIVSNAVTLMSNTSNANNYAWGCEFSSNSSKFYGSNLYANGANFGGLYQWDLCAGSTVAIVASVFTVTAYNNTNNYGNMQLASDGKIYISRFNNGSLDVIGNPNSLGGGCAYSPLGQSISPKSGTYGLPNFMGSLFNQLPVVGPFTYTASNLYGCQTASFNAPALVQSLTSTCSASGFSLVSVLWNFGNPATGASNTSTLMNPTHAFSSLGSYSVNLILNYGCGGGNDTIKQVVNITQSCYTINSTSITCSSLGSATVVPLVGTGPFSYTWMPSNQTGSVVTGLSPGIYTLTIFDLGTNFTYTSTATFTSAVTFTGNLSYSGSITCNGVNTGTASYTNIQGGTSNQIYTWYNGSQTYTTNNSFVSALSGGSWTTTVADAASGCSFSNVITISQPPALTLNLIPSPSTQCVNASVTINSNISGGTGPYTYFWIGSGATSSDNIVSQNSAGVYTYTLNSKDSYSCPVSQTTSVTFIQIPTLTITNAYICPLETGTLSASGATSYSWTSPTTTVGTTASSFTDNPLTNQQYTVVGSALGCSNIATANILIKPIPVPLISSNNPRCNGQTLTFAAIGGTSYTWTGPQSLLALSSSVSIPNSSPFNSGVYNVTLTAANSCTATASINLTVNLTPTISAIGSTLCSTQTLNLSSSSDPGATYYWTGPLGYNSTLQNPSISNPPATASGNYTVRATSALNCTNATVANVTVTALPPILPVSNSPLCFGNTLQLNIGNTPSISIYNWIGPNSFNSSSQNPTISNVGLVSTGVYSLTVTTGPCVSSATTAVLVNSLPTPTATNNGPVCEKVKVILNVTASAGNTLNAYVWQGPNNFVAYTAQAQIDTSRLISTGVYTVLVTDSYGCQNISTTSVTILDNPLVKAGCNKACLNDPAYLNATGADFYKWYFAGNNISNLSQVIIPNATNLVPLVYTVIGTALNSCTASATATLATWALPQPSASVYPNDKGCLNSSFILTGDGAVQYVWAGPNNRFFVGNTVYLIANNMAFSGIYTLTGIDINNCKTKVTTQITVLDLPQGTLSKGIKEACIPFTSDYVFNPSSLTNSLSAFSWDIDGTSYTTTAFTKTFNKAGSYVLKSRMTDMNGCSNTMSVLINAWPQPVADFTFTPAKPIENLDMVQFINSSPNPNITNWNWYFAPDINTKTGYTSDKENTNYLFKESGKYPVAFVIKNQNGCADSVVKVITIEEDNNVFVPNVFTPNGDRHNEIFMPVTRGIKEYHFYVYDRWNELMFESTDPNTGWDGTFKGSDCKQEEYVWKLVVSSKKDLEKTYNGTVLLMR